MNLRARFAAAWPATVLALGLGGCASLPPPATNTPAAAAPGAPSPDTQAPALDGAVAMVVSAVAMLGQPYRYGGAAPGGFDCSGLVLFAAGSAGVRLPRTAREQMAVGTPIERREVRAGDLVFMHLSGKELHVGIALDPERFIHAPSTGERVRIDSLDAAPYSSGFLSARRVIEGAAASAERPGESAER